MAGIFFRTKSALDGKPIIVAAVLPKSAKNSKTGKLAQVYILPDTGKAPHVSFKDGDYESVCMGCPHLYSGACYVDRTKGSRGVWIGVQNLKSYREVTPEEFGEILAGLNVRWGADGDPAAIPKDQFAVISRYVTSCTGYTHHWKWANHLKNHCMASCDTPVDRVKAAALGWRTFRVRLDDDAMLPGEFVCPASSEAGMTKQCSDCMACDGNLRGERRASPVIIAHGLAHKVQKYKTFRLSLALHA